MNRKKTHSPGLEGVVSESNQIPYGIGNGQKRKEVRPDAVRTSFSGVGNGVKMRFVVHRGRGSKRLRTEVAVTKGQQGGGGGGG